MKIIGSDMTGLEISNEEMADIIKLVKLIDKNCQWKIINEVKEQKIKFISMLLSALDVTLLENLLANKEVKQSKTFAKQAKITDAELPNLIYPNEE